jgi:urease accessory protein
MIRATQIHAAGQWSGEPADRIVLDYDQRHRRRVAMSGTGGLEFLLDLAQAVPLRDGDGLALEDGRIVAVDAAPEPLAEIRAVTPAGLLRVAWHLGNRHLPTQLLGDCLRIRRDPVIEDMVDHLGAIVTHIVAAFDPEGGAYAHGHPDHHHDDATGRLEHDDRLDD